MVTTESLGIDTFSDAFAGYHSVQQLSWMSRQLLFIKLGIEIIRREKAACRAAWRLGW
jgi:hypothetical protein